MLLEVLESAGNVGQDGEAEVLCLRPSWVRRKDREQLINAMREMELKAKGAQAFAAFRRSKREAKKEKAEAAVGTGKIHKLHFTDVNISIANDVCRYAYTQSQFSSHQLDWRIDKSLKTGYFDWLQVQGDPSVDHFTIEKVSSLFGSLF